MRILGLDASTSTVGFAVVETGDLSLVEIGHVSLRKFTGLIAKTDHTMEHLKRIVVEHAVDSIWLEEPVQHFSPGMSSAYTILLLSNFNQMIVYGVHLVLNYDVTMVKPSEARRSCDLILTTKAKASGANQKMQVFAQLTREDGLLRDVEMLRSKTGLLRTENYDRADAYVVARHGALVSTRK